MLIYIKLGLLGLFIVIFAIIQLITLIQPHISGHKRPFRLNILLSLLLTTHPSILREHGIMLIKLFMTPFGWLFYRRDVRMVVLLYLFGKVLWFGQVLIVVFGLNMLPVRLGLKWLLRLGLRLKMGVLVYVALEGLFLLLTLKLGMVLMHELFIIIILKLLNLLMNRLRLVLRP